MNEQVWKPIETAPKDGTFVDLLMPSGERLTDFKWRSHGVAGWCREEGYPSVTRVILVQPTHWMMPPPAPAKELTDMTNYGKKPRKRRSLRTVE